MAWTPTDALSLLDISACKAKPYNIVGNLGACSRFLPASIIPHCDSQGSTCRKQSMGKLEAFWLHEESEHVYWCRAFLG